MSEQIFDVDQANFEEEVIKSSHERIVVVDLWAPWCGPCRTLGPILEEVISSLGEGVALAKVNVDENQDLAAAFQVQGIPAVKIFKDGQVVEEFAGALPRAQIEEILRPLVSTEADDLLTQADTLADNGDLESAAHLYEQVLEERPEDSQALMGLARVRLVEEDFEAVKNLAAKIGQGTPEYDQAQALLNQIEFRQTCEQCGGRASLARQLLADPSDLESRFNFACCAAAEGDYATALKEWLEVVERKKDFRDGAAKDAMVSIFPLLGRDHEIVADYPRKLYRTLY